MFTSYLHVKIDLQFNYRVRRKWSCFKALSVGWYNCVYNEWSARFFDTLSSTAVDRRRSASGINALLSIKLSLPNFCRVICQVTYYFFSGKLKVSNKKSRSKGNPRHVDGLVFDRKWELGNVHVPGKFLGCKFVPSVRLSFPVPSYFCDNRNCDISGGNAG